MQRGMEEVHARLARLRRAGIIDADDRRVVDLPADLQPGSPSDV